MLEQYGITREYARDCMRLYRDVNLLPAKKPGRPPVTETEANLPSLREYEAMSKEELIKELVKAKITEARLKKGYWVEGGGAKKEYIRFESKNTK